MSKISKQIKLLIASILVITGLFVFSVVSGAGGGGSGGAGGGSAGASGGSSGAGSEMIFGGKITSVIPCTCPSNVGSKVVVVTGGGLNGQFSGTYLKNQATISIGKSKILPSRNIIGKFVPGGICLMLSYPSCVPGPTITKGLIIKDATN